MSVARLESSSMRVLDLFEGFVVHEAGSILGYLELPFLYVLAKLPASYQSRNIGQPFDHPYMVADVSQEVLRECLESRSAGQESQSDCQPCY